MEKIVVEFGPSSQISLRVTSLKTILATKLAPRILLPAVTKCYSEVVDTKKVRVFLFFIVTKSLAHLCLCWGWGRELAGQKSGKKKWVDLKTV